ncbi:MAG: hypothetical protein ACR2GT_01000 [Gaiellaceae bacterium]
MRCGGGRPPAPGAPPSTSSVLYSGLSGDGVVFVVRRDGRLTITVTPQVRLATLDGLRARGVRLRCVYGAPRGRTSRVQKLSGIRFPSGGRSITVRPRFAGERSNHAPRCLVSGPGRRVLVQAVLFRPTAWSPIASGFSPSSSELRVTLEARGVAPRYSGGVRLKISGPDRWPDGSPDAVFCRLSWLGEDGFYKRIRLGLRARDRVVRVERRSSLTSLLFPQVSLCEFSRTSYGSVLHVPMRPAVFIVE